MCCCPLSQGARLILFESCLGRVGIKGRIIAPDDGIQRLTVHGDLKPPAATAVQAAKFVEPRRKQGLTVWWILDRVFLSTVDARRT